MVPNNKSKITIHPIPALAEGKKIQPMEKEVGQLSLDIFKTDKEIIILAPVAGVTKDDIAISVTNDILIIKGMRVQKFNPPESDYYTKECFWGGFSRSIVLPLEADTKNITANFENSILEIHIPRVEREGTKIIKIKAPQ